MSFIANLFSKKREEVFLLDNEDIQLLETNVFYYRQLSSVKKKDFEKQVAVFIHAIPIYFKDTKPSRLVVLLVASSAVIVTFGRAFSYQNNLSSVLIVSKVLSQSKNGYVLGEVRQVNSTKTMTLSEKALIQSFKNNNDKLHVGIHEFVHILDVADGNMDGIPSFFMPVAYIELWTQLAKKEMNTIRKHKSSIRAYGATNLQEFLTVCSEYFFEKPKKLQKDFPKIYSLLSKTFNQNPIDDYDFKLKSQSNAAKKVGRNDPCPCGSGKKYKYCCMRK